MVSRGGCAGQTALAQAKIPRRLPSGIFRHALNSARHFQMLLPKITMWFVIVIPSPEVIIAPDKGFVELARLSSMKHP